MALTAKSATKPFTGQIPRDGSNVGIQIGAARFVTQDATASPKTSPLTVSSVEIALTVPDNAIQLVINNNANALRVYETSGSSSYFLIPASTTGFTIDCSEMTNVYMIRDSVDVTVQFMFITL